MYKQLIINVLDHETRVALLEDGTIVELYVDRGDDSDVAGNIFKGKVLRVLPGMQAAFVDIGLNQAAFIYVDDVYTSDIKEYERLFQIDSEELEAETGSLFSHNPQGSFPIRQGRRSSESRCWRPRDRPHTLRPPSRPLAPFHSQSVYAPPALQSALPLPSGPGPLGMIWESQPPRPGGNRSWPH